MSAQPTPRPWTVGPHQRIISGGWSIRIADGSAIAYVLGERNPELQANARLIAAAPDLLEALKRIVDWDDCGMALTAHHIDEAKAAIRKATEGGAA